MKKQFLECLIRECVVEILEAMPMAQPDTAGAPAPPAGGQGSADTPAIPQEPIQVPTQAIPRGVYFVDPKKAGQPEYKGDPLKTLAGKDPGQTEREVYRIATKSGGPRIKISSAALREIPRVLAGQVPTLYLYIGKQDPEDSDDEIYVLPAKNFQQAKQSSVPPGVSAEHPTTAIPDPNLGEPAKQPQDAGKTLAPDIDESSGLRGMIGSMVREALRESRRK